MSALNEIPTIERNPRFEWQPLVAGLVIWTAWGWLFRPIFPYLQRIFTKNDFRTNQVLLVLVVGLIIHQLVEHHADGHRLELGWPVLRRWPLIISIGCAVGYLLIERFLDVNTLAASMLAFGSYGLLGLWIRPKRWLVGLPAALLIVLTLPFGHHMQTFIGYPMRIATAAIVRDLLSSAGIGYVGIDTILILENGISHIDLPCSGVQSLWTGTMFLLAATWLEEKRISARWFLIVTLLMVLLFLANLARVAVLTVTGSVLGWQLFAEMLHIPLGVLGFVLACGAALWLLKRLPSPNLSQREGDLAPQKGAVERGHPYANTLNRPKIAPLLIAALFVGLSFLYTERPSFATTFETQVWQFDSSIEVTPFPLKSYEAEWLTRDGAESAERVTFKSGNLSGSIILITSRTWRAHHSPERCFEVYGLTIDQSTTHLVDQTFPIRLVTLGEGTYTANYWFQSAEITTDDYATRIWDDLQRKRDRWVLVSMIFDEGVDVNSAEVKAFYETIHATVAETLESG